MHIDFSRLYKSLMIKKLLILFAIQSVGDKSVKGVGARYML